MLVIEIVLLNNVLKGYEKEMKEEINDLKFS